MSTIEVPDSLPTFMGLDTHIVALAEQAKADVEALETSVALALPALAKKTVTLDATITGSADTNGTPNTPINVGTALPAGAVVIATVLTLTTACDLTTATVDVGWAGATESLIKDFDAVGSTAGGATYAKGATAVSYPVAASGKQVAVIVTPGVGEKLSAATTLSLTISVYYFVTSDVA